MPCAKPKARRWWLSLSPWLHAQPNRLSRRIRLAEAIRYGLRHGQGLSEFLSDGRLEMDTNTVEREIRPVAVTVRQHYSRAVRVAVRMGPSLSR